MKRKLRVLFASSEAVPFIKTGGLGDVAGSLPKALNETGAAEVRVIIPKYKNIPDEYKNKMTHVCDFYMMLGWRHVYCGIETLTHQGVTYYFVDNEYYFKRDNAYGYFDDGERIAFFSKAVCEFLQYVDFKCDVLHCNDWHTALSTVFLREFYRNVPGYDNIKTLFTVHNLKFQGQMSDAVLGDILGLAEIPAAANQLRSDRVSINFMKGALCYSDLLSTVSETYAREIQTPYFGENMQEIYRRRHNELCGIMNGIDQEDYNPETDINLPAHFSIDNMSGKEECKAALQRELGLEVNDHVPLITMCGRLTQQKGLDLVQHVLDELLQLPLQFAVLGTGDREYEDMFRGFQARYPGKMAACITFNEGLAHRLYAGGDFFLMPSLFEPCGLSQMMAMRYGNLPVVRETGGLRDSVQPYNRFTGEGTGFSFANYNAHEMLFTIKNAMGVYYDNKDALAQLRRQAMSRDFSWKAAAEKYLIVYRRLHPEIEAPEAEEQPAEEKTSAKKNTAKRTGAKKTAAKKSTAKKTKTKKSTSKKNVEKKGK